MSKNTQNILAKSIGAYINLLSYIAPNKAFAIAYKFFSEPRKGKIKVDKIPKTLQKAYQQTYSFQEHQIQTYTWKGNEETILLIHGWESNASRWKKLLPYLKKTGKTIIAIDAPAHGLSSGKEFNVPLYAEFINQIVMKFNPHIVIGHSIGGNAVAYFQSNYQHNFDKIVLLGAPSDFKIILENYFKILGLNSKIKQQFLVYIKSRFTIEIEDFSAANFLKESTLPGIIAHDVNDIVVRIEEGKKIANSWKTATFIETKELGHSLHDAILYQTISDFIEK
jgi:esterase/lipase